MTRRRSVRRVVVVACVLLGFARFGDAIASEPVTFPLFEPHKNYPRKYPERPSGWDDHVKKGYSAPCLAADRALDLWELDYLLQLSDFILDKTDADPDLRERAASQLGQIGHQYAIPALLAAYRDEFDKERVRIAALRALSTIRDQRIIEYLIEALLDQNHAVASAAQRELYRITGRDPKTYKSLHEDSLDISRDLVAHEWEQWWKQNAAEVSLRSRRTRNGDMMGGMGGPFGSFFLDNNPAPDCGKRNPDHPEEPTPPAD